MKSKGERKLEIGSTFEVEHFAEQLDGSRVVVIGFWREETPTAEYAREIGAKRGHEVGLVRRTEIVRGFWQSRISGSNEYRKVPNWDCGPYEILRRWKWYPRSREWREVTNPEGGKR
ncbi:MAG: hypothetical protein KAY24_00305 [Candidatus Eisenbacteria sp.]|nr:hypothetical protein [Candidatus Eisenbacteria bacterium]